MRLTAALFSSVVIAALAGCDKHSPAPVAPPKQVAASTQAASPVKVMEAEAAATATAQGNAGEAAGGTCGGSMDSCSGGCDQWDGEAAEVARRVVPDGAAWKTIKVSGMTCGGCERRIIANLGKLDGVLAVEADAELGEVRVATAKSSDLRAAAVERINSLGYSAQ